VRYIGDIMEYLQTLNNSLPKTKEEYVTDNLRENILIGNLKPGQRLDQDEIASSLNVSRNPVQTAIRTLAAEGLVEISPHFGATIIDLSPTTVSEIYQIRAMIEGYAAMEAASKLTEDHLIDLKSLLDTLNNTTDRDKRITLNRQFHDSIYQVALSPYPLWIIKNLRNTTLVYFQASSPVNYQENLNAEHQRIFDACVKRDGSAARVETERHIDGVRQQVIKNMTKIDTEIE
jgi:DNA-binding GntR family transcriptional regulator